LENWQQYTCSKQGCHKPLIYKNTVSAKHNKGKHHEIRYVCTNTAMMKHLETFLPLWLWDEFIEVGLLVKQEHPYVFS
jgi:hypothetical protein